jgi:hypothetical protein
MKSLREWATPLTIGAFAVMSVTGVLMFFHLDTALNKTVHQWAGWVMVAGVMAHVMVNWAAFKRYLLASPLGRTLIALGILALAASFVPFGGPKGPSPGGMALRAVVRAPLAVVAPLAGRPAPEIIEELARAGIALPNADASIASVVGDDRALQAKAIGVLFRKP